MSFSFVPIVGEKLLSCPFDKSHVVREERLGIHLEKCRTNYYKKMNRGGHHVDLWPCKFNEVHLYPMVEMEFHEKHCPDRYNEVPQLAYKPAKKTNAPTFAELTQFKKVMERCNVPMCEDWEVDNVLHPGAAFLFNPDYKEVAYWKKAQEQAAKDKAAEEQDAFRVLY